MIILLDLELLINKFS